ncbi:putative leucine-rich repeat-containing protein DDB_G0290503 [Magallana gigas]|uniref:putative leucine-rich repeat-containing protein DDB_G0290503 n=1 Tax=Magallana gigas TaxID=29159 RepID=UPI003341AFBD
MNENKSFPFKCVLILVCSLVKGQVIYLPTNVGQHSVFTDGTEHKIHSYEEQGLPTSNELVKLREVFGRQIAELKLRNLELYKRVTIIETSLVDQGMSIESHEIDTSYLNEGSSELNAKLLNLETRFENEFSNRKRDHTDIIRRLGILESEIKIGSSNLQTLTSSLRSKSTENGELHSKIRGIEVNNTAMLRSISNLERKNQESNLIIQKLNSSNMNIASRLEKNITELKSTSFDIGEKVESIISFQATLNKTAEELRQVTEHNGHQIREIKQNTLDLTNDIATIKTDYLESNVEQFRKERLSTLAMVTNLTSYFKKSYRFLFTSVERVNISLDTINNTVGNLKKSCNHGISKSENDNSERHTTSSSDTLAVPDFLNKTSKQAEYGDFQIHSSLSTDIDDIHRRLRNLKRTLVRLTDKQAMTEMEVKNLQSNQSMVTVSLNNQNYSLEFLKSSLNFTLGYLHAFNLSILNTSLSMSSSFRNCSQSKINEYDQDNNSLYINFLNFFENDSIKHNTTIQELNNTVKRIVLAFERSYKLVHKTLEEKFGLLQNKITSIDRHIDLEAINVTLLQQKISDLQNITYLNLTMTENIFKIMLEEQIHVLSTNISGITKHISKLAQAYDNLTTDVDLFKKGHGISQNNASSSSRDFLSLVFELQQNMSSAHITTTKIWRQCNFTEKRVRNLSSIVAAYSSLDVDQIKNIEKKISILQNNISIISVSVGSEANKLRQGIVNLEQKIFHNKTQQENKLQLMIGAEFQVLKLNISDIHKNVDSVKTTVQILDSKTNANRENVSLCLSEISKLSLNQDQTNLQLASTKTILLSLKNDLDNLSSSVEDIRQCLNQSVLKSSQPPQIQISSMELRFIYFNQSLIEIKSSYNDSMRVIQKHAREISMLSKEQTQLAKKMKKFDDNVSDINASTTIEKAVKIQIMDNIKDLQKNLTLYQQNMQSLKSAIIGLQQNVSSAHMTTSEIWRQCNLTEQRVSNISDIVALCNSSNADQFKSVHVKLSILQNNLTSVSVGSKADNLDKVKQEIVNLEQKMFHNLTQQENKLQLLLVSKFQPLMENISDIQTKADTVKTVMQLLKSKVNANEANMTQCLLHVRNLSSAHGQMVSIIKDMQRNFTLNQQNMRHLKSAHLQLQQNVSSSRLMTLKNFTEQHVTNLSAIVSAYSSLDTDQFKNIEKKISILQNNLSNISISVGSEANKLRQGIANLEQKIFHNLTQQENKLQFMFGAEFKVLMSNISDIQTNTDSVKTALQIFNTKISENGENVSLCFSEISKLSSNHDQTNLQLASAKTIQHSLKTDLNNLSSTVIDIRQFLNQSVMKSSKSSQTQMSAMEMRLTYINQSLIDFKSNFDESVLTIQNHTQNIAILSNEQMHITNRIRNVEDNVSSIDATTKQDKSMILQIQSKIKDLKDNLTFNQQNVQDFKSAFLGLQQNVSSGHITTSKIWRQCNLTEQRVKNISDHVTAYSSLDADQFKNIEKKISILQNNMSSISISVQSEPMKLKQRIVSLKQEIAHNLTQQENKLQLMFGTEFQVLKANISDTQINVDSLETSIQLFESKLDKNKANVSLCLSEISKLYLNHNQTNLQLAGAKTIQHSLKTDLNNLSSTVKDIRQFLNQSVMKSSKSSQTQISAMEMRLTYINQSLIDFKSNFDESVLTIQNHTQNIAILSNKQMHFTNRIRNVEDNVSSIDAITKQDKSMILQIQSKIKDLKDNLTFNQQNVQDFKSAFLGLQQNVSSGHITTSKIWRQCNLTEQRVKNISDHVTAYSSLDADQFKNIEKKISILQNNMSSISISVQSEPMKLKQRIVSLKQEIAHNLTQQENKLQLMFGTEFQVLKANISDTQINVDSLETSIQLFESKLDKNKANVSLCLSEISKLYLNHNQTNLQLAGAKTIQHSLKTDLNNLSSTVKDIRQFLNQSVMKSSKSSQTQISAMEMRLTYINQSLIDFKSNFDESVLTIQNHTQNIAILSNKQMHFTNRIRNVEDNVSSIDAITKQDKSMILQIQSKIKDLKVNLTFNQQNVQDFKSAFLGLQQNVSSGHITTSKIWRQCNLTEQRVKNISDHVTAYSSLDADQFKNIEKKISILQNNMSSISISVQSEPMKLKQRIVSLKQEIAHNLTQQENKLQLMFGTEFQVLKANISDTQINVDSLETSIQLFESKLDKNKANVSLCLSEISKLYLNHNQTNLQLAGAKTIQHSLKTDLNNLSSTVKDIRQFLNQSVMKSSKSSQTQISAMEMRLTYINQSLIDFKSNFDESVLTIQNHTQNIAILSNKQMHFTNRIRNVEDNVSSIDAITKQDKSMILQIQSKIKDLKDNLTFNQQNVQDFKSAFLGLQQNVSSGHITTSKIWRQCNLTEQLLQNMSASDDKISLLEKDVITLQNNFSTIVHNMTIYFEKLDQIMTTSGEHQTQLQDNHALISSLVQNITEQDGRLRQISDELTLNRESIAYVENNLTSLITRIDDVSLTGGVVLRTTTHPFPQSAQTTVQRTLQPTTTSTVHTRVRLVGGSTSNQGRVEVYANGVWGTVCDDSWDSSDARVVCRMLGFTGSSSAYERARYGEGTGRILLDDVDCAGWETSIFSCRHGGLGVHNCGHSEDASVICY